MLAQLGLRGPPCGARRPWRLGSRAAASPVRPSPSNARSSARVRAGGRNASSAAPGLGELELAHGGNGAGPRGRGRGGNGGGGGDGFARGSRGGGDDDSSPSLEWYLRAFTTMLSAVALYVLLGRASAPQRRRHAAAAEAAAADEASKARSELEPRVLRDDISALKRLQREAFEQLTRINSRLESADAGPSGRSGGGGGSGADGSTCSAAMHGCCALLLPAAADEHAGEAARAAADCGLSSGLEARVRARSWARGRSLGLLADLSTAPGSAAALQQPRLRKVLATWKLREGLKLVASLLGGVGGDAVVTLNPLAGHGATHLLQQGSGLHRLCAGRGVGAVLSRPDNTLGLSLLQAWQPAGEGGPASGLLLQVAGAASRSIMLGAHALLSGGLPLPALPAGLTPQWLPGQLRPPPPRAAGLGAAAAGGRRFGVTGAWNLGDEATLSGWCSLEQGGRAWPPPDWGLTLGAITQEAGSSWALSMGRCAAGGLQALRGGPLVAEALLRFAPDERLAVAPSLVGLKPARGPAALALALRCEWRF